MAKKKQSKKTAHGVRGTDPRQVPKIRVIEAGEEEQGAQQPTTGGQSNPEQAVRQMQVEEYRHGGIPIGSDPRE